ncbi:MAG: hypothetical protein ACFFCW_07585 [Candidatus Hodarchaeota archaeon]
MFFNLEYLPAHPVYRIHEALEVFLRNALTEDVFSEELFPEWFRPILARSRSLRGKFEEAFNSLRLIDATKRESVLEAFLNNNDIERLCVDKSYGIVTLTGSLSGISGSLRRVCEHLYDSTLQRVGFRDEGIENGIKDHYIKFRHLNSLVCPFCGIENYPDKESGLRGSYDHYLNRARYHFSGVNFKNLIPMCRSCNEPPNKGPKDVLNGRGRRRQIFYPYGANAGVNLGVLCTKMPEIDDNEGEWSVEVRPVEAGDVEKVDTWKEVFCITKRLQARIKEKHNIWVRDFLAIKYGGIMKCKISNLRSAFKKRSNSLAHPELFKVENESILKGAFFEYLADRADDVILEGYLYHCESPYTKATASRGEFLK